MNPITLPVSELKSALAGLGKIISRRPTLPILGQVRIERTREGIIELTGTDLDRTAIVRLEKRDQGEPFTVLVPLEDLVNLTKSCARQESLILARGEKDQAVIRFPVGGQILEHHCPSLPVAEFPEIVNVPGAFTALDTSLRQSIHEALACASTDETRLILNGAYLDVSKPGAHYVVGADGRHLFSSNSFTIALAGSVVLPSHPFLGWKGFNEDGDWRLRVQPATDKDPAILELATEHWRYLCRSCEGNYPNWRHVVPSGKDATGSITIGAEAMEPIIGIIARLPEHDPEHHALGLVMENGKVQALVKATAEQPWSPVELPGARAEGQEVKTFVNRHYLLKALRFGLSRIELIDALSPLRLHAGGRQMIVMPVRGQEIAPNAAPALAPTASANPKPEAASPAPKKAEAPTPDAPKTNAGRSQLNAEEPRPALDQALAQVEIVRGDFRTVLTGLNKLGDLLKQVQREQKAGEKEIQSVRATLRSLQSVRI